MAATITKLRAFLASLNSLRRGRKQQPARRRLWLEELEPRLAPATVQFSAPSETVNETAGTFSIPVTLTGAPQPTVTTFASGFTKPLGLAFDAAGNLYVANYGLTNGQTNPVDQVTPAGVVTTFAPGFSTPFGLAFDASGNLYVANYGGSTTVDKVTPAGVVSTFVSGLSNPAALAFDASGNLYVAVGPNGNVDGFVDKITPAGVVSTFASGFIDADALAFDAAGNLYVANGGAPLGQSSTVDKVTPAGVVSTFASGFNQPFGLAFDAAGNLYVANAGDGTVSVVTPAGVVSAFASGFNEPAGLAFDASGNLYVANFGGSTVSEVSDSVTVPFTLGGTATAGTDYSGVTASPLVITTGQTTATITGTLLSDPGPSQTLTFTLGTPSGASLGSPAVNTLTITEPAVAAAIASTSGGSQSATVNTAFANPLVATVTDSNGNPVSGVTVTFVGPSSGAGVTFPDGNTATTNAQGQASISVTANASAGSYNVTASVSGVATPAGFALTNSPGVVSLSQSSVTVSPTSIQAGGTATVTLTAEDANGNQETSGGLQVAFALGTGTGSGTFSAVTDNGNGTYTAAFTGTVAGNVTILATINNQPIPATVSLSIASGSQPPPLPPVISGPADISALVGIQLGPLTPVRKGRRKAPGSFEQTLTITNNSPDLIQGPIALVLDNLGPFKRVRHHMVPQATLLDADGITLDIAPGSPFLFANALGDQLGPLEAVSFVLDFHTKGSRNITFDTVVLVGFAQP
jgi:sugar lactone lactonase YvrE